MGRDKDAENISEQARGDVDPELLTGTKSGGVLSVGYFADGPLVNRLDNDERLQYAVSNLTKGVEIKRNGEVESFSPTTNYRTTLLVTDQRLLFVVGQNGGDHTEEVPYTRVESASTTTGVLKDKLVVKCSDAIYSIYTQKADNTGAVSKYVERAARDARDSTGETEDGSKTMDVTRNEASSAQIKEHSTAMSDSGGSDGDSTADNRREEMLAELEDLDTSRPTLTKSVIETESSFRLEGFVDEFGSLDDAIEEARGSDTTTEKSGDEEPSDDDTMKSPDISTADDEQTDPTDLSPNELAELYDAFGRFHTLLESVVDELDQREATTVEKWQEAVYEYWSGRGPSGAPSYGRQQRDRNEFSIHEYRDTFGDGDQVTDFHHHDVDSVDERARAALSDQEPVVPVAPESDTSLPVLVHDDNDLKTAKGLLSEFPAYPEADIEPPEDAVSESDDPVSLPEGRVERVEITVLDREVDPDSRRDASMQVRTADGAEMSLDIWSTHNISTDWTVGATYALEQSRHKSWDTDTGLSHELSSTKDLRVTRLDEEVSHSQQQTRNRPTSSSHTTEPSRTDHAEGKDDAGHTPSKEKSAGSSTEPEDNDRHQPTESRSSDDGESEDDDPEGILDDVISEFEEMSDMESS